MSLKTALRTASTFGLCLGSILAAAPNAHAAADPLVAARNKFFGAENVDQHTGAVRKDKVIVSWITNASLAVSLEGQVVLLDTYLNRLEVAPAPGEPDLRRTPINVSDLVDLQPRAIFLGHGHGDHADNRRCHFHPRRDST